MLQKQVNWQKTRLIGNDLPNLSNFFTVQVFYCTVHEDATFQNVLESKIVVNMDFAHFLA